MEVKIPCNLYVFKKIMEVYKWVFPYMETTTIY